jgi:hypothetical protein
LIKNGRYYQDSTTYKSNIIQPIVHHKFDDIIKECMSRKNQVVRKALANKKTEIVKDTFLNTVENLKSSNQMQNSNKLNDFSVTCKGTEEFKKKLDIYKNNFRRTESLSFLKNQRAN